MLPTKSTSAKSEPSFQPDFVDSATFSKRTYSCDWLVENVLVAGQPCVVGGPKKSLKTSIVVDLAISLGTSQAFLNFFKVPKPVPVAVLSGESGAASVQNVARRVCRSKQVRLDGNCSVFWSTRLPRLSSSLHRKQLRETLKQREIAVVVIDPLYLCLLEGVKSVSASNLYEIGPLLRAVSEACLHVGATPVFVHHSTKSVTRRPNGAPPELDDLAFSGIGEFARQWLLVNRREAYQPGSGEHRLTMSVGGSAGQSGCYDLRVSEGTLSKDFTGRKWRVRIEPLDNAAFESIRNKGPRCSDLV